MNYASAFDSSISSSPSSLASGSGMRNVVQINNSIFYYVLRGIWFYSYLQLQLLHKNLERYAVLTHFLDTNRVDSDHEQMPAHLAPLPVLITFTASNHQHSIIFMQRDTRYPMGRQNEKTRAVEPNVYFEQTATGPDNVNRSICCSLNCSCNLEYAGSLSCNCTCISSCWRFC
jgi:hypothetical protein